MTIFVLFLYNRYYIWGPINYKFTIFKLRQRGSSHNLQYRYYIYFSFHLKQLFCKTMAFEKFIFVGYRFLFVSPWIILNLLLVRWRMLSTVSKFHQRKVPVPYCTTQSKYCLLTGTVCDIINSSYQEKRLPSSWKDADIVPLPKQKPITDVNKHMCPISLTSIISKIAEDHIVETSGSQEDRPTPVWHDTEVKFHLRPN